MPETRDRKRKILEKQLENLWQDFEAAISQSTRTIDAVEGNRLKRQAEHLYEQIEEIDQELKKLEATGSTGHNRLHLELQEKLPRIDFKTLEPTIRKILDSSGQGCAALLLLQKSETMGGHLCGVRIREMLRGMTRDFKHWPVEIEARGRRDELALLGKLGAYLKLDPAGKDLQIYSKSVIQRVCGSLQSGSVVFMEFHKWDYLAPPSRVVCWFLDFWQDLVRALADVSPACRQVKVFAVIFVDGPLPENCLTNDCLCTVGEFQQEKILEIPLETWTQQEIKEWLELYSQFPGPQIDSIADKIYRSTGGDPDRVERSLLDECCPATSINPGD